MREQFLRLLQNRYSHMRVEKWIGRKRACMLRVLVFWFTGNIGAWYFPLILGAHHQQKPVRRKTIGHLDTHTHARHTKESLSETKKQDKVFAE